MGDDCKKVLISALNSQGGAYVSAETLGEETGLGYARINAAVEVLSAQGLVKVRYGGERDGVTDGFNFNSLELTLNGRIAARELQSP